MSTDKFKEVVETLLQLGKLKEQALEDMRKLNGRIKDLEERILPEMQRMKTDEIETDKGTVSIANRKTTVGLKKDSINQALLQHFNNDARMAKAALEKILVFKSQVVGEKQSLKIKSK